MSYETAIQQWRAGTRFVTELPPERERTAQRVEDAIVAELRRRYGGAFTAEELVTGYESGTAWCLELARRTAPRDPWSWDGRLFDAAFARYLRGAVDFAGGRRLEAGP